MRVFGVLILAAAVFMCAAALVYGDFITAVAMATTAVVVILGLAND